MITFSISVNSDKDVDSLILNNAIDNLINDIENLSGIIIEKEHIKKKGARGSYFDLSSIIIKAIELGVFAGIYTAILDFYDRFKNSEVTLNFENGSSVVIKGLSQKKALELIKEHSKPKKENE